MTFRKSEGHNPDTLVWLSAGFVTSGWFADRWRGEG